MVLSIVVNLLYLFREKFSSKSFIAFALSLELLEYEKHANLGGVEASQMHSLFLLLFLIFCLVLNQYLDKNYWTLHCF
jgi:hypothetical protein